MTPKRRAELENTAKDAVKNNTPLSFVLGPEDVLDLLTAVDQTTPLNKRIEDLTGELDKLREMILTDNGMEKLGAFNLILDELNMLRKIVREYPDNGNPTWVPQDVALEMLAAVKPLIVEGEPNTLCAMVVKAVPLALRTETAEKNARILREALEDVRRWRDSKWSDSPEALLVVDKALQDTLTEIPD